MFSRHSFVLAATLTLGCAGALASEEEKDKEKERAGELPATTALDDYVKKADASYGWRLVRREPMEGATAFLLELTSQTWRDPSEVDRTVWKHWLTVVRPDVLASRTALLFIGGGRNDGREPRRVDQRVAGIGLLSQGVAVELRMVPNQPLVFDGDGRPRLEDDLVAYSWLMNMKSGDPTWLARMPMVKSAVRAMDAVQEFLRSEEGGGTAIESFVVAGGSKRGWTTWLTGAVDPRVVAIMPIVIDVVNVIPSMEHHYAAYGFWAPAIGDYERSGIADMRDDPRYHRLLRLVDPYYYRHRLAMPKYIVNSAGDQFFLPDSSQFYFDDLAGEKHLRYVPNTDHGLRDSDAGESLQAFFFMITHGRKRPEFSWAYDEERAEFRVESADAPTAVRQWHATNPAARDFRLESLGPVWKSSEVARDGDAWVARIARPEAGFTASFVELTFPSGGPNPIKFTTAVKVVPDVLPHAGKLNERLEERKK